MICLPWWPDLASFAGQLGVGSAPPFVAPETPEALSGAIKNAHLPPATIPARASLDRDDKMRKGAVQDDNPLAELKKAPSGEAWCFPAPAWLS